MIDKSQRDGLRTFQNCSWSWVDEIAPSFGNLPAYAEGHRIELSELLDTCDELEQQLEDANELSHIRSDNLVTYAEEFDKLQQQLRLAEMQNFDHETAMVALQAENATLKESLAFYASPANHKKPAEGTRGLSPVELDGGLRARKILEVNDAT